MVPSINDWNRRQKLFIVMIVIVTAIIVDHSIVGIATSAGGMRSSVHDITLFTIMVLIFAIGQYVILRFVESKYLDGTNKSPITKTRIHWIHRITVFLQYHFSGDPCFSHFSDRFLIKLSYL